MTTTPTRALPAAQWVRYLEHAGILPSETGKPASAQAKAIAAGKWLGAKVGRTIAICINGRTGKATLRVAAGRAREKKYWLEVVWDDASEGDATPTAPQPEPTGNGKPRTQWPLPLWLPPALIPAGVVNTGNRETWD